MSLLTEVLAATRAGGTPSRVAAQLGVAVPLVEAAVDHWQRLGVITTAGACLVCEPSPEKPACVTCPMASLPRLADRSGTASTR